MTGIGDTGGCGAVEIVVAVGGILVVVTALEVDIGRETAVGVGFGVLFVSPSDFEVAEAVVGGAVASDALFSDAVTYVEVAFVFVAHIVVAAGFGGPAEVSVNLAEEGEVDIVVEGKVVASVFEVVASVVHPTVGGHEDAGGTAMGDGEEGEGQSNGGGDVLYGDVGGASDELVASYDLGFGEVDGEMRMGVVAGGVETAVEVHHRVVHLLDAGAVEEPVALLGDDARDEAFLGVVVEDDGIGYIFGFVLFEEGVAAHLAVGIQHRLGVEHLFVEINTHIVGLEHHAVIFDIAVVEELRVAFVDV